MKIKSINITFGYSCNNRCIHCIIGYGERKKSRDRSTEELKICLREAKEKKAQQVILIGGEPTIRTDFFEILEFARSLDIKLHLETNGRMFASEEFTKKTLVMIPDLDVAMSFHHPNPKIQDSITGVKDSFEQSVAGMKNMKKYGLKHLTVIPVITRFNYESLSDLVKFLANLSVDEIDFTLLRIGGNAEKNLNSLFVPIEEIQPHLFEAIETGKRLGIDVKTYGFPFCMIKGYENHAYELSFIKTFSENETYVFNELNGEIDWQKERLAIKAKWKSCKNCKHFKRCEGIWKEYIQLNLLKPTVVYP